MKNYRILGNTHPLTSYFSGYLGYLLNEFLASANHVWVRVSLCWGRWSRAPLPPKKVLSSIRRFRSHQTMNGLATSGAGWGHRILWKNKRWSTIYVHTYTHRYILYCTSHCIALRCIALHCVVLHCIALHCIAASHHITSRHVTSRHITYTHTHIHTCTHAHMHTCTHAHMHTYTHRHT